MKQLISRIFFIAFLALVAVLLWTYSQDSGQDVLEDSSRTELSQSSEVKIAVLGDSISAGYGLPKEQSFPTLLEQKLNAQSGHRTEVINAGVSGSTSAGGVSRLAWVLRAKPDVVILQLGGNDGLRGLELKVLEDNLSEMIEQFQKSGVKLNRRRMEKNLFFLLFLVIPVAVPISVAVPIAITASFLYPI